METTNLVKIEGLYNLAYRAYINISFSPEKRAERTVIEHEQELNEDLKLIPESEQQRYIDNYVKYLKSWLGAMSGCYSVMITGGSNFNNSRHEKANRAENARREEFLNWREGALKAIEKKIEENKPIEQKTNERWEKLRKEISQKIEWGFVANCYSMIERLAHNGELELVNNCLNLITEYNSTHSRPFMTNRHKVWQLPKIAEKAREKAEQMQTKESQDEIINGVRVVKNFQADRLQLYFEGKPSTETISTLKHSAFKWSPSNGCWQRQLTNNAIYAMQTILKNL